MRSKTIGPSVDRLRSGGKLITVRIIATSGVTVTSYLR